MKILAIRGKNLASLAGAFAVEFDQPPLSHTGLFAITGPTGSGKSTLLDAMCLALFDKIPRFQSKHSYNLGDNLTKKLLSTDVRNILRRGASAGSAEVDFIGKDGYRYRAAWSLARTRRGKGPMGKQTISFQDLDRKQALGSSRKKETLAQIKDKLGLDFHQFRRSVLLAQGDFAAFLKAAPNERAELLERMTGTDLYSKISIAAYQKSAEAAQRYETMNEGLKHLEVMEDDKRKELEERLRLNESQQAAHQAQRDKLKKMELWFERETQLVTALDEARIELARAEEAWTDAQPKQQELNEIDAVQTLRPLPEAVDRSLDQAEKAEQRLKQAESELAETEKRGVAAKDLYERTALKRESAAKELESAKPELDRAKKLDTLLSENEARLERARGRLKEKQASVKTVKTELDSLEDQRAELAQSILETRQWLSDHADDEAISKDWSYLQAELKRCAAFRQEHRKQDEDLKALASDLERAEASRAENRKLLAQAEQAYSEATAAAKVANEQAEKHPVAVRRARLETLNDQCQGLTAYHKHWLEKRECASRIEKLERQIIEDEEQARALSRQTQQNETRLQEAEFSLNQVKATLDFEARRPELLAAGAPCPLCGSLDHPYLSDQVAHKVFSDQEARVIKLRSQNKAFLHESAEIGARQKERAASRTELVARLELVTLELKAAEEALGAWRASLPAGLEELSEFLAELQRSRDTAVEELRRADDDDQKARAAERKAASLQESLSRYRDLAHEADKTFDQKQSLRQRAIEEKARIERDLDKTEQRLQDLLQARDREALERSPAAFLVDSERRVLAWRERQTKNEAEHAEQTQLELKLSGARERYRERSEAIEPISRDLTQWEQERQSLTERRLALFDGQPVATIEDQLKKSRADAETAYETARDQLAQLDNQISSLKERREHLGKDRTDKIDDLAQKRDKLQTELAKMAIDEPTLRHRLRFDDAWRLAQRAELDQLEKARRHWRSLHQERDNLVTAHRATDAPDRKREVIAQELTALGELIASLEEKLTDDRYKIRLDDDRQRQRQEKLPQVEEQRRHADLCKEMSDLIGSAKGDKFRKFAQGLTLDGLVAAANFHLRDLQPRYRLERVPGEDLELRIVDRDMADDPRGVNSLSGGESFLVSLALALGLSSLSADQTTIESLFIDEGFGTLDVHSLDGALEALDSLQATGKTIGVISHLSAVAARVGAQIEVKPMAHAGSRLEITSC